MRGGVFAETSHIVVTDVNNRKVGAVREGEFLPRIVGGGDDAFGGHQQGEAGKGVKN